MLFRTRLAKRALSILFSVGVGTALLSACSNMEDLVEPQGNIDQDTDQDAEMAEVIEPNRVSIEISNGQPVIPDAITAGPTYFEIINNSDQTYQFQISGQGIQASPDNAVPANNTDTLYINLEPGEYQVSYGESESDLTTANMTVVGL
jgi:hypothetical protein